jgi:hypothetical protein
MLNLGIFQSPDFAFLSLPLITFVDKLLLLSEHGSAKFYLYIGAYCPVAKRRRVKVFRSFRENCGSRKHEHDFRKNLTLSKAH